MLQGVYRGLPKLSPPRLDFGKGGKGLTLARVGLDFGKSADDETDYCKTV